MKIMTVILSLLAGGFANFDRTVCDFGTIYSKDGPQTCEFTITNDGQENMFILAVTTSCGCTDVNWTRNAVKPGESGKVTVTYDNDEGPGTFDKSVSVYLKDVKKPVTLHVRGEVTNKRKK